MYRFGVRVPRAQPSQHNNRRRPLMQAMVPVDAPGRAPAMQQVDVLVLIPSSAIGFIYADRYKIRREEADAVSRAERIISGGGTWRLWVILAECHPTRARSCAWTRARMRWTRSATEEGVRGVCLWASRCVGLWLCIRVRVGLRRADERCGVEVSRSGLRGQGDGCQGVSKDPV